MNKKILLRIYMKILKDKLCLRKEDLKFIKRFLYLLLIKKLKKLFKKVKIQKKNKFVNKFMRI